MFIGYNETWRGKINSTLRKVEEEKNIFPKIEHESDNLSLLHATINMF